ncbi:MAG TPA: Uma2 family endonuclease [Phycisphaerae bacterium]|nr:Uma2 family endonuclease [Phycisphaerae bacterium]
MTLLELHPFEMPQPHRFTREEYYRLNDLGFFEGRRVELIEGEIVEMAPQKEPHVLGVSLTCRALEKAFGEHFWVRCQAPLSLGQISDPEPDLAVVPGQPRDYAGKGHPSTALLVVEVADATLRYDRTLKAALYARAGVQDYWIVNVVDNVVEVHREPIQEGIAAGVEGKELRWRYRAVSSVRPPAMISPLALPGKPMDVATMLP